MIVNCFLHFHLIFLCVSTLKQLGTKEFAIMSVLTWKLPSTESNNNVKKLYCLNFNIFKMDFSKYMLCFLQILNQKWSRNNSSDSETK